MTEFQILPRLLLVAFALIASIASADEPQPARRETPRQLAAEQAEALLGLVDGGTLDDALLDRQQRLVDALQQLVSGQRGSSTDENSSEDHGETPVPREPTNSGSSKAPAETGGPSIPAIAPQQPRALKPLADAIWGHLPDRERDELYQSYSEQYLPQYDSALRKYFRALAELEHVPTSSEAKAPADAP